jgi:hypothetical protein
VRADSALPKLKKSRTDMLEANREIPYRLAELPSRMNDRTEQLLPKLM